MPIPTVFRRDGSMPGKFTLLALLLAPAILSAQAPAGSGRAPSAQVVQRDQQGITAPFENPPPAPAPRPATVRVDIQTSMGGIVLELEKQRAPITTANFLHYVDQKRFDGIAFYRAMRVDGAPQTGLIQAGIRDARLLYPPIAHESTGRTGLSHVDGTISMAREAPGSARADFFITLGNMPYMDFDPTQKGDNLGYAAFGHVVEGMDVVRRIYAAPTSPTAGIGAMKGQMLAPTIRILSIRRSK